MLTQKEKELTLMIENKILSLTDIRNKILLTEIPILLEKVDNLNKHANDLLFQKEYLKEIKEFITDEELK